MQTTPTCGGREAVPPQYRSAPAGGLQALQVCGHRLLPIRLLQLLLLRLFDLLLRLAPAVCCFKCAGAAGQELTAPCQGGGQIREHIPLVASPAAAGCCCASGSLRRCLWLLLGHSSAGAVPSAIRLPHCLLPLEAISRRWLHHCCWGHRCCGLRLLHC